MGFLAAAGPALTAAAPYVAAGTAVVAAQQASAIGSYNQAIQNRNALIAEQEVAQQEKQKEFDIARFDQQFARLQGQTRTNVLFSGAELSGSGLRILRQNAEQAEIEKDILDYNSKVKQFQKDEEANFARMSGNLAKRQAGLQALGYYSTAGTSLLGAFG
tara:strand:- start:1675 stop:2154 length:480 start_codon:yes stop_codon:yes gene_type:complete